MKHNLIATKFREIGPHAIQVLSSRIKPTSVFLPPLEGNLPRNALHEVFKLLRNEI